MSSPATRRARPRTAATSREHPVVDTATQLTLIDLAATHQGAKLAAVAPRATERRPTPSPRAREHPERDDSAASGEPAEASVAAGPVLLLTVPEAARLLGIGRTSVYKLLTTGELASVHIGASRRIPLDAVHALIRTLSGGEPNSDRAWEPT